MMLMSKSLCQICLGPKPDPDSLQKQNPTNALNEKKINYYKKFHNSKAEGQ